MDPILTHPIQCNVDCVDSKGREEGKLIEETRKVVGLNEMKSVTIDKISEA